MTEEPPYTDAKPHVQITHHPEGYKVAIYLRPADLETLASTGQLWVDEEDDGSAPTIDVMDIPVNPGGQKLASFKINR